MYGHDEEDKRNRYDGRNRFQFPPGYLRGLAKATIRTEEDLSSGELEKPLFHVPLVAALHTRRLAIRTRDRGEEQFQMVGHTDRTIASRRYSDPLAFGSVIDKKIDKPYAMILIYRCLEPCFSVVHSPPAFLDDFITF